VSAVPVAYEVEARESPATWREHAQCKGSTHLFFASPLERPGRKARRERLARTLCAGCPVQHPCRSWARGHREFGFWGGETEDERSRAGYRPSLRGPGAPADPEAWDLRVLL
jgi:WhiB family redox-sensing transcriptional regulator